MYVTRRLVIVGLAALALVAISTGPSSDAAFSGRNGAIVFSSDRDGDYELFTIRADGRGLRRLTRNRVDDRCPAWSPDGRRVAFSRERERGSDLFVLRLGGSHPRRVLRSPGWDGCPAWSPDGRRLAFHRLVMNTEPTKRIQDIYTVRLDGRGLRRLTVEGSSFNPSWSMGNRIAWHYRADILGFYDIFTMKHDGSDRRRLTTNANNSDPNWSPDGRRLVFSGGENINEIDRELFAVNADGSGLVELTQTDSWSWYPAWSPDGGWIVYSYVAGKKFDLGLVRADGSGPRRLTSTRGSDIEPDWGPALR
jgi:TolB protein